MPAMLIAGSALLLKVPLNLLFIHGGEYGGVVVPAMGGVGCGWASAIAMVYELLALIAVVAFSRVSGAGLLARFSWPDWHGMWRLIRLGLPIGASIFLEFSMFSVVTLLIGRLGVDAVAAHQIAANVGGMTFMAPMALGMAVSIRVGFNIGANDLPAARRSGWVAIGAALVFALVAALLVFYSRGLIAGMYSKEAPVLMMAMDLMLFVVFYQFFDDAQVTAIGALRGFKDTRAPMWVAIVSYWTVGLPVGVMLSSGWFGTGLAGVRGFWAGLTLALVVAAVILVARFRWLSHAEDRVAQLARG